MMTYEIIEDLLIEDVAESRHGSNDQLAATLAKQILEENDYSPKRKKSWRPPVLGFSNMCAESRYLLSKQILKIQDEIFDLQGKRNLISLRMEFDSFQLIQEIPE